MKKILTYLKIAKAASQLSNESTKIGALALNDKDRIVGVGVNGYPSGYDDNDETGEHSKVIHAEMNAVLNSEAKPGDIKTIVLYGLPPCGECMKFLIAHGVKRIYFQSNNSIKSLQKYCAIHDEHRVHHGNHIQIEEICNDRRSI